MIGYHPIGIIHTPFDESFTPHQPVERDEGESRIVIDEAHAAALSDLSGFRYIYVLFHLDRVAGPVTPRVRPPWAGGIEVGLFASRSPARPNPIGLSVVRLKRVEGTTLVTSILDAYDGTPVLDIKPYVRGLDSKADADIGWIAGLPDGDHVLDHVRGLQHGHHDD